MCLMNERKERDQKDNLGSTYCCELLFLEQMSQPILPPPHLWGVCVRERGRKKEEIDVRSMKIKKDGV